MSEPSSRGSGGDAAASAMAETAGMPALPPLPGVLGPPGAMAVDKSDGAPSRTLSDDAGDPVSVDKSDGAPSRTLSEELALNALTSMKSDAVPTGGALYKHPKKRQAAKVSFEDRIAALTAYKAAHGHIHVKRTEDKSLAQFLSDMRQKYNRPGKHKRKQLTDAQIAALNELEFKWEPQRKGNRTFDERVEDLRAFKAQHGHLNVNNRAGGAGLNKFCGRVRRERKHPGRDGIFELTKERIAALDELGFDWMTAKYKSFQQKVDGLKAYQGEHGHLDVTTNEDEKLAQFVVEVRRERQVPGSGGPKLTKERIAALDALGFEWRGHLYWKKPEPPKKRAKGEEGEKKMPAKKKAKRAMVEADQAAWAGAVSALEVYTTSKEGPGPDPNAEKRAEEATSEEPKAASAGSEEDMRQAKSASPEGRDEESKAGGAEPEDTQQLRSRIRELEEEVSRCRAKIKE